VKNLLRNLSVAFAAGCAGGAAGAVLLWLVAEALLRRETGFAITVKVTPGWMSHFVLLGGLWGFLQLIPIPKTSLWKRGLILAALPIVAMLTEFALLPKTGGYFFPLVLAKTKPWTEIGALLVWGQVSSLWFAKAK